MVDKLFADINGRNLNEIKADPEALRSLLQLASLLILNGGSPNFCEACIRDYYSQIISNFEKLKKNFLMKINRKNKPKWVGIKYVQGAFFDSATLTDEQAVDALRRGYLRESDFEVLPHLAEVREDVPQVTNFELELDEENVPAQPKRGRKKSN